MLKTENLTYRYPDGKAFSFPDITCPKGTHCLILGPSGMGKSTLLHLLGGLMRPQGGTIMIAGTRTESLAGHQLDLFRGKHIGIVFQRTHFIRALSVLDNITLAQKLADRPVDKEKAFELLRRLNIADKASKKTYNLSQGEQQRVAIARAMVNQPEVILADEPTSALDDYNAESVIALLLQQATAEQSSLVVVTHDARIKPHFPTQYTLKA